MLINLWKWLIFKVGDLRWCGWRYFPFIMTFGSKEPEIDQYEVHEIIPKLFSGDVLILRHDGFASNLGIGGAFIHAAIYLGNNDVVEALSDDQGGVCKRHVATALAADKLIVLRPRLNKFEKSNAVEIAKKLIGFKYDIFFDFDIAKEKAMIELDYETAKAGKVKFCCTEIPYYCYMDYIDKLELYRETNISVFTEFLEIFGLLIGKRILRADSYIESDFDVIYVSKNITLDWLKKRGCGNGVINKVKSFMETK